MKAKEYYEKYFSDDLTKIGQEEYEKRVLAFFKDLTNEALKLCETRKTNTNEGLMSALKEMDGRWNSVSNMIEKKYGIPLLKRNGVTYYWNKRFEEERERLKEKNDVKD